MFMDPVTVLTACGIRATQTIADFGAGSGFVAQAAAAFVPQGQVFAIEVNKDVATRITRDALDKKIANLHVLWGDVEMPEGSKLAADSVDIVLCFNTLFLLEDKAGVAREAYRVLKPGGKIVVIDWTESFGGIGPRPHHVFPQGVAETLLQNAGFKKLPVQVPAGDHHYAILFEK